MDNSFSSSTKSYCKERQENLVLDKMSLGERAIINQFQRRLSESSSRFNTTTDKNVSSHKNLEEAS